MDKINELVSLHSNGLDRFKRDAGELASNFTPNNASIQSATLVSRIRDI
jgi:hypothetical protein